MPTEHRAAAPSLPRTETAVRVVGLDFAVPEKHILHAISLDAKRSEIVAVMGKSGCGKTTLLKCLAGLLKPTGGQIFLRLGEEASEQDIVPLSESELDTVRLKIGLVFQYAALFDSLTVYENVAFGLRHHRLNGRKRNEEEIRETVQARLAEVGIENAEKLYPPQLSGGMKKRVGLARALAIEPSVLLYDEPTSGLDPVIARNIDDLIVETRDRLGMTSIVVSHDIASIFRIADRIAMLDTGRLVAFDTPDVLLASDNPIVQEFVQRR